MLIDTDRFNFRQVGLPLHSCSCKDKKTHAEETSERPGEARAPGPLPSAKSRSRVQSRLPPVTSSEAAAPSLGTGAHE